MRTKQSTKRPAARARTVPGGTQHGATSRPLTGDAVDMNPGLQGVDPPGARYSGRRESFSVEDPLHDWPEDGASEDDDWLLDREVQRPWGV